MPYRRIGLLLLEGLIAVFFTLQALVKLGGSSTWIARFRGWGYPDHFYLVVGGLELLGAILLVIPKTRLYGAACLAVIMAGAFFTHVLHREPQFVSALVILALLAVVVVARSRISPQSKSERTVVAAGDPPGSA